MSESRAVGLRERKRARTSSAIHNAAVHLVLERGFDAATIDAISERADVSTRTFFNYFPSKEDAVLGIDEAAISGELDKPREAPDDLFLAVFDLLYALFEAGGGKHDDPDLTREVIQRHPQLMTRQMLRVAEVEGRLSEIVAEWMAGDPRFAADSEAERLDEARIVIGICMATVRVSMKKWASERNAGAADADGSVDPRKTYERSITTLRTVLERLS
ncbi:TetR/AcrR family transcriptional regulator [Microbacterium deminutum]|uniref:TetR family transcriptional regulator n=1 Tax=Microbacterium deminutum TaxID=344164 RepID=A0ABN2QIF1_9MICO